MIRISSTETMEITVIDKDQQYGDYGDYRNLALGAACAFVAVKCKTAEADLDSVIIGKTVADAEDAFNPAVLSGKAEAFG